MKTRLKIYKMATSILLKFLTLKWDISRTICPIKVSDGSFFCIFYTLSFELNFYFDRSFPLTAVKDRLIKYCNTTTSRNGVNSMWIVKNSSSLLSSLDQLDVRTATSVQTYDFSTLDTSIPHNLLKSRITALVLNSFKRRYGNNRYTHIKITSGRSDMRNGRVLDS